IKSKVKQGLTEEAISDYDAIYQNNPNTSKGLHALINKVCLLNMTEGDNPNSTSSGNHKADLLALIFGKDAKNNHTRTSSTLPSAYKLHQNYPNPFNPVTTIRYEIPGNNTVTVKIYDLLGREVFTSTEYKTAGSYEVRFDGTNFASGMYFYSIDAGNFRDVKKMVLLK
ncbi:MAG: T9SS type A sorting domain-containing protein, partial [Ignavibacteria bacterium]